MHFVYHHRTMGRSSQAMHIRSLVEALRADNQSVAVLSLPGVDPMKTAGQMPFLRKEDKARGVQRIWKYISRECPQFVFELFELFYNFFIPFRLLPALWRRRDAVLYERHAYFMFMGVLLSKWLGHTVVLEVNELSGFERARGLRMSGLARRIDSFVFSRADHILCVSSVLAKEALQRGAASERVHVVPNAIDTRRFRGDKRREMLRGQLGLGNSVVIGHVGLFYRWDRLDALIEVSKELRSRGLEIKLLLVGDGPEMDNIQQVVRQLGMDDDVILSGPLPSEDVPAYIDAMDICVLPHSNAFGSPIALFEFMAMAKATAAPDLGPIQDVIEHNVTGVLFPAGDYEALKDSLCLLVQNAPLRAEIGSRAQQAVFQRHTWAANADFVVQLASGPAAGMDISQSDYRARQIGRGI